MGTIRRYGMFSRGETVAAGVSGGADSMCMLSLLRECEEELGVSLTAVYVNHGIRGAEADADEAFVRDWCGAAGIPFTARRVDVPALVKQTGDSAELCARRARYEIFSSLGADKIATAHTGSDRTETMLMNLARGAGLHGLCAIPPVRGNIVRPLIDFTRRETEAYCRGHNIAFVTDSTNLTDEYTRNRFRHTVIPAMEAINPAFENNALRCLELLAKDDAYLRKTALRRFDALYDPVSGSMPVAGLLGEAESVRSRVLMLFFERVSNGDYEYRHIERLTENGFAPCSVTLPCGGVIVSDGGRIYVKRAEAPQKSLPAVSVPKTGTQPVSFGRFRIVFSVADARYADVKNAVCVDSDKTDKVLTVRARQPGDRITLPRRRCTKTLKKYFNEIGIPAKERDAVPVICDSRGVIAAGRTADASRMPDQETKNILIIKTECDNNDQ